MLEILLFVALGIILGVVMGLTPGVHPNMIVLAIPILVALSIETLPLLSFMVALGVTNSIVDFIPSIFFGAPKGGNELSVLPGHRMLMSGYGYQAVKLSVIGGVGATLIVTLLLPFLLIIIPAVYSKIHHIIYLLLLSIVLLMVLTENGRNRIIAVFIFILSGSIGLITNKIPLDNTLILFPIFSGFFGLSLLILQVRQKTQVPKQGRKELYLSRKSTNRSIVFGSIGGVFSGFLPGVGSSEIATIATVEKNDKSFLVTIGALTTANVILSILSLWLISKPRSGLAIVINQFANIGLNEVIFIALVAMVSVGISAVLTLKLAKYFLGIMERIKYIYLNVCVIVLIVVLTLIFTGLVGLLLLILCTSLGIFTNLAGVKRGILMGVLILPTMLFYAGF